MERKETRPPLGDRIRQLRLARGLTLDELAAATGLVTKQSISKYERDKTAPSPRVLNKIAQALDVKAIHLTTEPVCRVEIVAYRKAAALKKSTKDRLESILRHGLEERCRLQRLTTKCSDIPPIKEFRVKRLEHAESAAEQLRERWQLGIEPIANLVATLEDRSVHVLEVDAEDKFDGLSGIAYDDEGDIISAAVLTRKVTAGERQRLNIAHELGHIVLSVHEGVDEEKAAFRFGGAFLAPDCIIRREIGDKRSSIGVDEILLLKHRFGISLQALLYRLKELGIINESYHRAWCIRINQMGWRKEEPNRLPPESPQWMYRQVLHANAEGWLTPEESKRLVGEEIEMKTPLTLMQRRAFMKLPREERRRLLHEQAERLAKTYTQDQQWKALETGDLVES